MSFKLDLNEQLSQEIKRVVCEESKNAIELINSKNDDPHYAVHEVRKSLKKIRAALRLVRFSIPFYREENKFFRNEGRQIAELRDASSVIETWEKIVAKYSSKLYNDVFSAFNKALFEYRKGLTKEHVGNQQRLEGIKEDLKARLKEIASRDFDVTDFKDIETGLKTVYKRGLKAFAEAKAEGRDVDFHDWRKRVKYLRYQLELLNGIWPRYLSRFENELHELTDFLGLDHDLVVLNNMILTEKVGFRDKASKQLFFALLTRERELTQKRALLKGTKLYIDSPSEFCNKMEIYWNAHQKEKYDPRLMN